MPGRGRAHADERTEKHALVDQHGEPAHARVSRLLNEQKAVRDAMLVSASRTFIQHKATRMHTRARVEYAWTQMRAHPSCSAHLRSGAVLPPDLPQLQHVKHGLKDPHADGAASPGRADSHRRSRRARGRIHRGNIRGVHRWRVPTVLVAVLGA